MNAHWGLRGCASSWGASQTNCTGWLHMTGSGGMEVTFEVTATWRHSGSGVCGVQWESWAKVKVAGQRRGTWAKLAPGKGRCVALCSRPSLESSGVVCQDCQVCCTSFGEWKTHAIPVRVLARRPIATYWKGSSDTKESICILKWNNNKTLSNDQAKM